MNGPELFTYIGYLPLLLAFVDDRNGWGGHIRYYRGGGLFSYFHCRCYHRRCNGHHGRFDFSVCFSVAHSLITAHHGARSKFTTLTPLIRLNAQTPFRTSSCRPSTSPVQSTSAHRRRRIPSGVCIQYSTSEVCSLNFHRSACSRRRFDTSAGF